MRILVAEDDSRLLKSLVHIFETNHYVTDAVSNGQDAYDYAISNEYDGLILDIMMPGMDGITLLKKLRNSGIKTPALFLTARTEVHQRIEGLDAGADDYLPKPFSTDELLARVRAMLRRREFFTPDELVFANLRLNRSTYELGCNITVIFILIASLNLTSMNKMMDMLTDRISEGDGKFPDSFENRIPARPDMPSRPGNNVITPETPYSTRHFTVWFNSDGETVEYTEHIVSITDDEAKEYALKAVESGKDRGWISNYRYKIYNADKNGNDVIGFKIVLKS